MSKGTRVYAFRLPARLMREVRLTIARRNTWSQREDWSLSDFVRTALLEKIKKMERCRKGCRLTRRRSLAAEDLCDLALASVMGTDTDDDTRATQG